MQLQSLQKYLPLYPQLLKIGKHLLALQRLSWKGPFLNLKQWIRIQVLIQNLMDAERQSLSQHLMMEGLTL